MAEVNVQVAEVGGTVVDVATSADKLKNVLSDIYESMDTLYGKLESEKLKAHAKAIRDYLGTNQDSIVAVVEQEAGRMALVTDEMIAEDRREL
jgi:uncharacterized protein YaaR (DUF327 family)